MLESSSVLVGAIAALIMAAEPGDQAAIRAARTAQNTAIADGDLDRVASFWTEDVTVRRALGQPLDGRAAARQALEPPAAPGSRIVYQRLTKDVEVSAQWPLAFETGTWEGHLGSIGGPIVIGGRFSAQWVKRGGQWLIRSEVFVALTCSAVGCESVAVPDVAATRLERNPLITVNTSASLGGNVNGPTVIRVPDWIERPLGRYYMYFANHMGTFVRLAYADAIAGPWTIYEPGVLQVRDTAFFRPQPDPVETLADFYTHVASPEIFVDTARKRLVMWVHGWWTNGERWPSDPAAARAWARQRQYGQYTQAAESADGIHFEIRPPITRQSYLRVFQHDGFFYSVARLGQLARSKDPFAVFEPGPNPFRESAYADRVRHVGLLVRGRQLHVFFTAIGDAPERVLMSTIDLTSDWTTWRASTPVDVLRPETRYECADLAVAPSEPGDVEERVRQIRDPFVFEDEGRAFLFYSTCGEQGIAAASLVLESPRP